MQRKSSAHYQRVFRQRLREQGLVKKEVWILPENAAALAGIERMLRRPAAGAAHLEKEEDMTEARVWNARSLAEALSGTELFSSGEAQIELIEGAEASLYVIMREYGDLPVFVAPQGEQIIVEALLGRKATLPTRPPSTKRSCSAGNCSRCRASACSTCRARSAATACSAR